MEEETLIDRVQTEMQSDDEDREKQSAILLSVYEQADKKTKEAINEVFICLCGWSLDTLLNRKGS